MPRWPSAKFYFLNGKFLFFKWEIFCRRQMESFFHDRAASPSFAQTPALRFYAAPAAQDPHPKQKTCICHILVV